MNSSLAETWINVKNFTQVAVDICAPTKGLLADVREVVLQCILLHFS